jgi:hypothetical protein
MKTLRDCAFHFPNHKSVICHSARHRSTFRLSADATKTVFPKNGNPYQRAFTGCRLAFRSFWYWSRQEQAAINAWIEAIEEERGWEQADKEACIASRPGWKFSERKRPGFGYLSAARADGALAVHHSANSWRELHYVTK